VRPIVRIAALAFVAVIAASCASSTETVSGDAPGATAAGGTSGDAAPVEPAPTVAPLLGGGTFDLAAELATAPVAMWFWAPG
jgi:hypothetical protein